MGPILGICHQKQCSRQLQCKVPSRVCFISCQALGALHLTPYIEGTKCVGQTRSDGGQSGDRDIWPRLPIPHYHEVLAQKGLRTISISVLDPLHFIHTDASFPEDELQGDDSCCVKMSQLDVSLNQEGRSKGTGGVEKFWGLLFFVLKQNVQYKPKCRSFEGRRLAASFGEP